MCERSEITPEEPVQGEKTGGLVVSSSNMGGASELRLCSIPVGAAQPGDRNLGHFQEATVLLFSPAPNPSSSAAIVCRVTALGSHIGCVAAVLPGWAVPQLPS